MSVEPRRKGGKTRYVARWRQDGRQRARTFDRRRDATLGAHGLPEPSPMALGDWLRRWWEAHAPSWAPSTRRTHAGLLDLWISPYLEGVRLRDLGHARVRAWQAEIRAAGCTPKQAGKAARVLSAALGVAVREGLLPGNPVSGLRLAKQAPTRPHALTPEEVELVRAQMPTLRDVCLLGLLAYAGLRPGEVLALRWRDVGRVLVIDRSVSDGEIRQTKTNTRRTVDVIPPLAADLDLLRPKVADPDALVIHGERGQVLDLNNWRARTWKTACEAASVRTTPYDGRHSYASLLIHEGRSLPYVTAALGHASATTTLNHYADVFDEGRLATGAPMIEAVETARALLEARGVYTVCTRNPIRVLRSAPKAARTA
jgi:integrase